MAYPPKTTGPGETQINPKLDDKRRERLMNIKKREELKDVLIYKFKEKYGDHASNASKMIGSEVDKFVGNADVTEANLARLERRIHKRSQRADDDKSSVSNVSAYSVRDKPPPTPTPAATMPSIKEGDEKFDNFEWSKLDEYASYLHEQDAMRQKLGLHDMQKKLRADLDKQVADQRRKKNRQREEEQKYFHNQMVEIEQWKEMEKERDAEMRVKALKEKTDRDEQLAFDQKRRDEELSKQEKEEKALVSKIVREMEQEKIRMAAKKVQQREAMLRIMEENMEERRIKEEQKAKQQQMEIEGMREYNRILDQQEQARAEALESRINRQKELMEKMKENVVKQQQAKGDEDAKRALQQKEERDARDVEMERNKAQKLRQMRLETQDFLFAQMEEKEARKAQAVQLKGLQARILEEDTKEYMDMEKSRSLERHRLNLEHRLELDEQIRRKNQQTQEFKYCMSENEVSMNKQLLEVVEKTLKERDDADAEAVEA
jgi:hypothetical protein